MSDNPLPPHRHTLSLIYAVSEFDCGANDAVHG